MNRGLSLLAVMLCAAAHAAPVPTLAPTRSVYAVSWGVISVGEVTATLSSDDQPGCYRYQTTTQPAAFVKLLYGMPRERSRFCVIDGQVRSEQFESVLPGDDRQSYTLAFDYTRHTATDGHGRARTIPDQAVDSLSLHQAVRLWVAQHAKDAQPPVAEFTMVDRKNLTHYRFRLAGHETVQTPAGRFDTLKLARIDNPNKVGLFWVAESRDWQPVKIVTQNGSKPSVQLMLAR